MKLKEFLLAREDMQFPKLVVINAYEDTEESKSETRPWESHREKSIQLSARSVHLFLPYRLDTIQMMTNYDDLVSAHKITSTHLKQPYANLLSH
jgi:hypothetical protein